MQEGVSSTCTKQVSNELAMLETRIKGRNEGIQSTQETIVVNLMQRIRRLYQI